MSAPTLLRLAPGAVLGILGGGQLARMLALKIADPAAVTPAELDRWAAGMALPNSENSARPGTSASRL